MIGPQSPDTDSLADRHPLASHARGVRRAQQVIQAQDYPGIKPPNIKYMVSLETGPGTLVKRAATLVLVYWPRKEVFDHSLDKIIIYCRIREEMAQLADIVKCPTYTSRSGT